MHSQKPITERIPQFEKSKRDLIFLNGLSVSIAAKQQRCFLSLFEEVVA